MRVVVAAPSAQTAIARAVPVPAHSKVSGRLPSPKWTLKPIVRAARITSLSVSTMFPSMAGRPCPAPEQAARKSGGKPRPRGYCRNSVGSSVSNPRLTSKRMKAGLPARTLPSVWPRLTRAPRSTAMPSRLA